MAKKILSIFMCVLLLTFSLSDALADDFFPFAGNSLTGEEALVSASPGSVSAITGWKETEAYQDLEREYGSDNVSALLEEGFRDELATSIADLLELFGTNQTKYDTSEPGAGYGPISYTSITEIPPEYLLLIETLINKYSVEEKSILQEWEELRNELLGHAEKLDDEIQAHYEQAIRDLVERLKSVRTHQQNIKNVMENIVNGQKTPFKPYTLSDIEKYLSQFPQEDPGPQCVVEIVYRTRTWTSVGGGSEYLPGPTPVPTPAAPGAAAPTAATHIASEWETKTYRTTLTYDQVGNIKNVPVITSEDILPKGFVCAFFNPIGGRYVNHSVYKKAGNRAPNSLDDKIMKVIESFKGTDRYVDVKLTAIYIIYKSDANVSEDTYTMSMYTQTQIPPASESGWWEDSCTVRVQKKKEYKNFFKNFEKEMQDVLNEAETVMETLKQTIGWDDYLPGNGSTPGVPNLWVDDLEAVQTLHEYIDGKNNEFKSSKDKAIDSYKEFATGNAGKRLLNEVVLKGVSGMTAEELVNKLVEKYPRQFIAIKEWFQELEKELNNMQGFTDSNGISYSATQAKELMAINQLMLFASFRDTISVYEIIEATVTDISSSVIMSQSITSFSDGMYNWGIVSPTTGRSWQDVQRTSLPQLKHRFYSPGNYYVICTQNILYEVVSAVTVSFRGSICIKDTDGSLKTLYTWEKSGHMSEANDCKDDPRARDTDRCVAYYNFNLWTSEDRGEIDDYTGTVGRAVWQGMWTVTGDENLLSGLDQPYTTKRIG